MEVKPTFGSEITHFTMVIGQLHINQNCGKLILVLLVLPKSKIPIKTNMEDKFEMAALIFFLKRL
jgi:hypothetical protein